MEHIRYGNQLHLTPVLLTADNLDIVSGFDCAGQTDDDFADMDCIEYLHDYAVDDQEARTYVYVDEAGRNPIAFVSLACSSISNIEEHAGKEIRTACPAVLIDKFFVKKEFRHLQYAPETEPTLSEMIFLDILEKIEEISSTVIGAKYVVLYSTSRAQHFYKKCGMAEFGQYQEAVVDARVDECIPMYTLVY